jgi:hypothetical protein
MSDLKILKKLLKEQKQKSNPKNKPKKKIVDPDSNLKNRLYNDFNFYGNTNIRDTQPQFSNPAFNLISVPAVQSTQAWLNYGYNPDRVQQLQTYYNTPMSDLVSNKLRETPIEDEYKRLRTNQLLQLETARTNKIWSSSPFNNAPQSQGRQPEQLEQKGE